MLAPALVPPPPPPPCPCLEREISDFHSTPRRHRSTSRRNRTNSVNYRPISMRTFFLKPKINFTKRLKIVLQFSSAGFHKILFFSRISPHLRYFQGKLINHDKFLINFTHILFRSDWFIKLRKLKV